MCRGTIPRKHRPKKGTIEWFEIEREQGIFQGGEEEVKMGKDKNCI